MQDLSLHHIWEHQNLLKLADENEAPDLQKKRRLSNFDLKMS